MTNATRAAIQHLQKLLRKHFGQAATSDYGQTTLSIGADKIEITDEDNMIVARGPAKVATVLRRKRRSA
jgi:hypothetical protein